MLGLTNFAITVFLVGDHITKRMGNIDYIMNGFILLFLRIIFPKNGMFIKQYSLIGFNALIVLMQCICCIVYYCKSTCLR